MPISGGCPKPLFVQLWSQDLWSRPISISRLTLHFFPSTTRCGNSSDSPDPPDIACAMSWAVGNRSFGSNDMALVTTDRKSTRLNSSHVRISYAVFCLKKKKNDSPLHFLRCLCCVSFVLSLDSAC